MRLVLAALSCILLSACVTTGDELAAVKPPVQPAFAPISQAGFAPIAPGGKAVVASTMEIRVDTSAVGGIPPEKVGERLALALATITEFRPDTGTAVTPIVNAVAMPDNNGQMKRTTVYAPNAFRQSVWMDDHSKVKFLRSDVDPGWYLVHSYGSTAGFELNKPRIGQRGCLLRGAVPAPGVQPVALRAGEVGYFGHFVITIAVEPSGTPGEPYELSVADARIDPAPPGLDDILRRDGLNPEQVQRISADRFPCPWTVPRKTATG